MLLINIFVKIKCVLLWYMFLLVCTVILSIKCTPKLVLLIQVYEPMLYAKVRANLQLQQSHFYCQPFFADWIFMLNHFYHKKLEKIMCNYFQIWVLLRNYGLILGRFSMERDEEKKILKKMKSKYTKHWNILLNSIIKIMKKILKAFDLLPFWRKNLIKATIVLTLVTVKLKFICSILNGFWK